MTSRDKSFPAPVRGLIENENLAMNGGAGASVMENWFPLQSTVRVRGGALMVATIGSSPVLSLIPYNTGNVSKLFAASATAVYEITAFNTTTPPAAAFSGQTSGRWSYVQFGTSAGNYIVMANGTDSARYYDGTTWAALTAVSTPIAITGVTTSTLSHLWIHGTRIWAVQKGTLDAWYLPVDQIGGAMTRFPLASTFERGGSLLFGSSWSSDSGDGMDDRCGFFTTEGEVAVYEGTSPASASTWSKIGRYDFGSPVGSTVMRAGGDVLLSTTDGIIPLSQVVSTDPAGLAVKAVTRPIEPSWRRAVKLRDTTLPFITLKWAKENMGIVGLPHRNETFVVNVTTGAWGKYTGWDVQSLGLYADNAYFGDSTGSVFLCEGSGADDGLPYVARLQLLPDHLKAPGRTKALHLMRAIFRALAPFTASLSSTTDYQRDFPTPPAAAADDTSPALWDVGQWDVSQWDDSPDSEERQTITTQWRSVGRSGFSAAPQVQITSGGARRPDAELVTIDMTYEVGALVV